MKVSTKFFGELEAEEKDIISFKDSIPGFSNLVRFLVIHDDNNEYFSYLQSVENENVCFIITSPFFVMPNYSIYISDSLVKRLEIEEAQDVVLYCIVTIPEDMMKLTVNLKAPLVVNAKNRKGLQEVVDNEEYSIRHRIMKEADASC